MGPSGSGKTTLLDVLAGRKTTGAVYGHLQFGGATPSRAFLRRFTGYVEQFDTLLGILTVEEMLLYTAELKRPMSEPLDSKQAAVEEVLAALALTPCRAVRIGNPLTKGISGGQAKRTNIGIALVRRARHGACACSWRARISACLLLRMLLTLSRKKRRSQTRACSSWTSPPAGWTATRPMR